ncbi:MAG: PaaI family thioesterase [Acidimicrobiales bacterium]
MPLPKPEFPNYDPAIGAGLAQAGGSGGGLPAYLDIRTVEVGPGRMTCVMPVRDELLNPFGSLHGGVISALTDHVLGAVLYGVIERGAWAATTEFKLNLIAPVRSGEVTAEAEIVSMTKRTAVVRVDITNLGRAAGAGQGTVLIMPPRA